MSTPRTNGTAAQVPVPVPPAKTARGRPARYTRDGLLDLVVKTFNERGYEATSMEDLAQASGLTKSTFYHHVSGKEELLQLAVDRALGALSTALDDIDDIRDIGDGDGGDGDGDGAHRGDTGRRPVDQLEAAIRRTTEVLLAELPYVTLLLRVRGNTAVELAALERRRAIDSRLAALVKAAATAGEIRGDIDPRLVSRLLFGMVNSLTEWYRPVSRTNSPASVVNATVSLALEGLGARR
jgi:AcrR family transcriptional regulator